MLRGIDRVRKMALINPAGRYKIFDAIIIGILLSDMFPREGNCWAEAAHLPIESCVAFRMGGGWHSC